MRLLWGQETIIAEYVGETFPVVEQRGGLRFRHGVGIVDRDGKMVGAVVISEFRGHDGILNIFLERPVLTPRMLREMFGFVFRRLLMKRVTAHCQKKDRRARKLVEGIGFRFEGTMRYGGENGRDDLIVYGMTFDNCRWLA